MKASWPFAELLSESKSVGKVHWCTKTKPKDDSVAEDIKESVAPEKSVVYNCVLYGLPHLTLQEATK